MASFDYSEVFYNQRRVIRRSVRSGRRRSSGGARLRSDDGTLGGSYDSTILLDGHAAERPSAVFDR
jgi:hypothetical protein